MQFSTRTQYIIIGIGLIFGALFVASLVTRSFYFPLDFSFLKDGRYNEHAVHADAIVTGVDIRPDSCTGGRISNCTGNSTLTVRIDTAQGDSYISSITARSYIVSDYIAGDIIPVRYDPSDPSHFVLDYP